MKALAWALRLVIFLILFVFAAQNTAPITLNLALGRVWQAPLVIVLLAFFAVGALFGVLSLLALVFRQRREIARLRSELGRPAVPALVEPPSSA